MSKKQYNSTYLFLKLTRRPFFLELTSNGTVHVDEFSKNIVTDMRINFLITLERFMNLIIERRHGIYLRWFQF